VTFCDSAKRLFFYLLKYCCVSVLCVFFLFPSFCWGMKRASSCKLTILSVDLHLETFFFVRNGASLFLFDIVIVFFVAIEMTSDVNGN